MTSDLQNEGLQAYVDIDRDSASRMGVTVAAIDNALYNAFGQRLVSTIFTQSNQYRVVLEAPPALQRGLFALDNIYVTSSTGAQVRLTSVARVGERHAPLAINHVLAVTLRDGVVQSRARLFVGRRREGGGSQPAGIGCAGQRPGQFSRGVYSDISTNLANISTNPAANAQANNLDSLLECLEDLRLITVSLARANDINKKFQIEKAEQFFDRAHITDYISVIEKIKEINPDIARAIASLLDDVSNAEILDSIRFSKDSVSLYKNLEKLTIRLDAEIRLINFIKDPTYYKSAMKGFMEVLKYDQISNSDKMSYLRVILNLIEKFPNNRIKLRALRPLSNFLLNEKNDWEMKVQVRKIVDNSPLKTLLQDSGVPAAVSQALQFRKWRTPVLWDYIRLRLRVSAYVIYYYFKILKYLFTFDIEAMAEARRQARERAWGDYGSNLYGVSQEENLLRRWLFENAFNIFESRADLANFAFRANWFLSGNVRQTKTVQKLLEDLEAKIRARQNIQSDEELIKLNELIAERTIKTNNALKELIIKTRNTRNVQIGTKIQELITRITIINPEAKLDFEIFAAQTTINNLLPVNVSFYSILESISNAVSNFVENFSLRLAILKARISLLFRALKDSFNAARLNIWYWANYVPFWANLKARARDAIKNAFPPAPEIIGPTILPEVNLNIGTVPAATPQRVISTESQGKIAVVQESRASVNLSKNPSAGKWLNFYGKNRWVEITLDIMSIINNSLKVGDIAGKRKYNSEIETRLNEFLIDISDSAEKRIVYQFLREMADSIRNESRRTTGIENLIVLSSIRKDTLDKLGSYYETLAAYRPQIVAAGLTPYVSDAELQNLVFVMVNMEGKPVANTDYTWDFSFDLTPLDQIVLNGYLKDKNGIRTDAEVLSLNSQYEIGIFLNRNLTNGTPINLTGQGLGTQIASEIINYLPSNITLPFNILHEDTNNELLALINAGNAPKTLSELEDWFAGTALGKIFQKAGLNFILFREGSFPQARTINELNLSMFYANFRIGLASLTVNARRSAYSFDDFKTEFERLANETPDHPEEALATALDSYYGWNPKLDEASEAEILSFAMQKLRGPLSGAKHSITNILFNGYSPLSKSELPGKLISLSQIMGSERFTELMMLMLYGFGEAAKDELVVEDKDKLNNQIKFSELIDICQKNEISAPMEEVSQELVNRINLTNDAIENLTTNRLQPGRLPAIDKKKINNREMDGRLNALVNKIAEGLLRSLDPIYTANPARITEAGMPTTYTLGSSDAISENILFDKLTKGEQADLAAKGVIVNQAEAFAEAKANVIKVYLAAKKTLPEGFNALTAESIKNPEIQKTFKDAVSDIIQAFSKIHVAPFIEDPLIIFMDDKALGEWIQRHPWWKDRIKGVSDAEQIKLILGREIERFKEAVLNPAIRLSAEAAGWIGNLPKTAREAFEAFGPVFKENLDHFHSLHNTSSMIEFISISGSYSTVLRLQRSLTPPQFYTENAAITPEELRNKVMNELKAIGDKTSIEDIRQKIIQDNIENEKTGTLSIENEDLEQSSIKIVLDTVNEFLRDQKDNPDIVLKVSLALISLANNGETRLKITGNPTNRRIISNKYLNPEEKSNRDKIAWEGYYAFDTARSILTRLEGNIQIPKFVQLLLAIRFYKAFGDDFYHMLDQGGYVSSSSDINSLINKDKETVRRLFVNNGFGDQNISSFSEQIDNFNASIDSLKREERDLLWDSSTGLYSENGLITLKKYLDPSQQNINNSLLRLIYLYFNSDLATNYMDEAFVQKPELEKILAGRIIKGENNKEKISVDFNNMKAAKRKNIENVAKFFENASEDENYTALNSFISITPFIETPEDAARLIIKKIGKNRDPEAIKKAVRDVVRQAEEQGVEDPAIFIRGAFDYARDVFSSPETIESLIEAIMEPTDQDGKGIPQTAEFYQGVFQEINNYINEKTTAGELNVDYFLNILEGTFGFVSGDTVLPVAWAPGTAARNRLRAIETKGKEDVRQCVNWECEYGFKAIDGLSSSMLGKLNLTEADKLRVALIISRNGLGEAMRVAYDGHIELIQGEGTIKSFQKALGQDNEIFSLNQEEIEGGWLNNVINISDNESDNVVESIKQLSYLYFAGKLFTFGKDEYTKEGLALMAIMSNTRPIKSLAIEEFIKFIQAGTEDHYKAFVSGLNKDLSLSGVVSKIKTALTSQAAADIISIYSENQDLVSSVLLESLINSQTNAGEFYRLSDFVIEMFAKTKEKPEWIGTLESKITNMPRTIDIKSPAAGEYLQKEIMPVLVKAQSELNTMQSAFLANFKTEARANNIFDGLDTEYSKADAMDLVKDWFREDPVNRIGYFQSMGFFIGVDLSSKEAIENVINNVIVTEANFMFVKGVFAKEVLSPIIENEDMLSAPFQWLILHDIPIQGKVLEIWKGLIMKVFREVINPLELPKDIRNNIETKLSSNLNIAVDVVKVIQGAINEALGIVGRTEETDILYASFKNFLSYFHGLENIRPLEQAAARGWKFSGLSYFWTEFSVKIAQQVSQGQVQPFLTGIGVAPALKRNEIIEAAEPLSVEDEQISQEIITLLKLNEETAKSLKFKNMVRNLSVIINDYGKFREVIQGSALMIRGLEDKISDEVKLEALITLAENTERLTSLSSLNKGDNLVADPEIKAILRMALISYPEPAKLNANIIEDSLNTLSKLERVLGISTGIKNRKNILLMLLKGDNGINDLASKAEENRNVSEVIQGLQRLMPLRPFIDNSVSKEAVEKWINDTKDVDVKDALTKLFNEGVFEELVRHVDEQEFETAYLASAASYKNMYKESKNDSFFSALLEAAGTYGENAGVKSNSWVYGMFSNMKEASSAFNSETKDVSRDVINATGKIHFRIDDDASYSGTQIAVLIEDISNKIFKMKASEGKEFVFDIVIPFLSEEAEMKIRQAVVSAASMNKNVKYSVVFHRAERIQRTSGILKKISETSENKELRNAALITNNYLKKEMLIKGNAFNASGVNMVFLYFDHKVPDFKSIYDYFLQFARFSDVASPYSNKAEKSYSEWISKHLPLIPKASEGVFNFEKQISVGGPSAAPVVVPAVAPTMGEELKEGIPYDVSEITELGISAKLGDKELIIPEMGYKVRLGNRIWGSIAEFKQHYDSQLKNNKVLKIQAIIRKGMISIMASQAGGAPAAPVTFTAQEMIALKNDILRLFKNGQPIPLFFYFANNPETLVTVALDNAYYELEDNKKAAFSKNIGDGIMKILENQENMMGEIYLYKAYKNISEGLTDAEKGVIEKSFIQSIKNVINNTQENMAETITWNINKAIRDFNLAGVTVNENDFNVLLMQAFREEAENALRLNDEAMSKKLLNQMNEVRQALASEYLTEFSKMPDINFGEINENTGDLIGEPGELEANNCEKLKEALNKANDYLFEVMKRVGGEEWATAGYNRNIEKIKKAAFVSNKPNQKTINDNFEFARQYMDIIKFRTTFLRSIFHELGHNYFHRILFLGNWEAFDEFFADTTGHLAIKDLNLPEPPREKDPFITVPENEPWHWFTGQFYEYLYYSAGNRELSSSFNLDRFAQAMIIIDKAINEVRIRKKLDYNNNYYFLDWDGFMKLLFTLYFADPAEETMIMQTVNNYVLENVIKTYDETVKLNPDQYYIYSFNVKTRDNKWEEEVQTGWEFNNFQVPQNKEQAASLAPVLPVAVPAAPGAITPAAAPAAPSAAPVVVPAVAPTMGEELKEGIPYDVSEITELGISAKLGDKELIIPEMGYKVRLGNRIWGSIAEFKQHYDSQLKNNKVLKIQAIIRKGMISIMASQAGGAPAAGPSFIYPPFINVTRVDSDKEKSFEDAIKGIFGYWMQPGPRFANQAEKDKAENNFRKALETVLSREDWANETLEGKDGEGNPLYMILLELTREPSTEIEGIGIPGQTNSTGLDIFVNMFNEIKSMPVNTAEEIENIYIELPIVVTPEMETAIEIINDYYKRELSMQDIGLLKKESVEVQGEYSLIGDAKELAKRFYEDKLFEYGAKGRGDVLFFDNVIRALEQRLKAPEKIVENISIGTEQEKGLLNTQELPAELINNVNDFAQTHLMDKVMEKFSEYMQEFVVEFKANSLKIKPYKTESYPQKKQAIYYFPKQEEDIDGYKCFFTPIINALQIPTGTVATSFDSSCEVIFYDENYFYFAIRSEASHGDFFEVGNKKAGNWYRVKFDYDVQLAGKDLFNFIEKLYNIANELDIGIEFKQVGFTEKSIAMYPEGIHVYPRFPANLSHEEAMSKLAEFYNEAKKMGIVFVENYNADHKEFAEWLKNHPSVPEEEPLLNALTDRPYELKEITVNGEMQFEDKEHMPNIPLKENKNIKLFIFKNNTYSKANFEDLLKWYSQLNKEVLGIRMIKSGDTLRFSSYQTGGAGAPTPIGGFVEGEVISENIGSEIVGIVKGMMSGVQAGFENIAANNIERDLNEVFERTGINAKVSDENFTAMVDQFCENKENAVLLEDNLKDFLNSWATDEKTFSLIVSRILNYYKQPVDMTMPVYKAVQNAIVGIKNTKKRNDVMDKILMNLFETNFKELMKENEAYGNIMVVTDPETASKLIGSEGDKLIGFTNTLHTLWRAYAQFYAYMGNLKEEDADLTANVAYFNALFSYYKIGDIKSDKIVRSGTNFVRQSSSVATYTLLDGDWIRQNMINKTDAQKTELVERILRYVLSQAKSAREREEIRAKAEEFGNILMTWLYPELGFASYAELLINNNREVTEEEAAKAVIREFAPFAKFSPEKGVSIVKERNALLNKAKDQVSAIMGRITVTGAVSAERPTAPLAPAAIPKAEAMKPAEKAQPAALPVTAKAVTGKPLVNEIPLEKIAEWAFVFLNPSKELENAVVNALKQFLGIEELNVISGKPIPIVFPRNFNPENPDEESMKLLTYCWLLVKNGAIPVIFQEGRYGIPMSSGFINEEVNGVLMNSYISGIKINGKTIPRVSYVVNGKVEKPVEEEAIRTAPKWVYKEALLENDIFKQELEEFGFKVENLGNVKLADTGEGGEITKQRLEEIVSGNNEVLEKIFDYDLANLETNRQFPDNQELDVNVFQLVQPETVRGVDYGGRPEDMPALMNQLKSNGIIEIFTDMTYMLAADNPLDVGAGAAAGKGHAPAGKKPNVNINDLIKMQAGLLAEYFHSLHEKQKQDTKKSDPFSQLRKDKVFAGEINKIQTLFNQMNIKDIEAEEFAFVVMWLYEKQLKNTLEMGRAQGRSITASINVSTDEDLIKAGVMAMHMVNLGFTDIRFSVSDQVLSNAESLKALQDISDKIKFEVMKKAEKEKKEVTARVYIKAADLESKLEATIAAKDTMRPAEYRDAINNIEREFSGFRVKFIEMGFIAYLPFDLLLIRDTVLSEINPKNIRVEVKARTLSKEEEALLKVCKTKGVKLVVDAISQPDRTTGELPRFQAAAEEGIFNPYDQNNLISTLAKMTGVQQLDPYSKGIEMGKTLIRGKDLSALAGKLASGEFTQLEKLREMISLRFARAKTFDLYAASKELYREMKDILGFNMPSVGIYLDKIASDMQKSDAAKRIEISGLFRGMMEYTIRQAIAEEYEKEDKDLNLLSKADQQAVVDLRIMALLNGIDLSIDHTKLQNIPDAVKHSKSELTKSLFEALQSNRNIKMIMDERIYFAVDQLVNTGDIQIPLEVGEDPEVARWTKAVIMDIFNDSLVDTRVRDTRKILQRMPIDIKAILRAA